MKKIIEGKLYNTDTARKVSEMSNGCSTSDFHYFEEALYKKRNGEYFLYGYGHAASKYAESCGQNEWCAGEKLIPLSFDSAKKWMEKYASVDKYEAEFGEASEDDETVTLCISLPASTADKLRRQSGEAGMPVSRYIAKLVENL